MDKLRETFLENIRALAAAKGLDYADVAERAGLSRSGIYKIMRGDREPGFDNIERIARALGVQPSRLLLEPEEVVRPTAEEALAIVGEALQSRGEKPSPTPIDGISEGELVELLAILRGHPRAIGAALAAARGFRGVNKRKDATG